MGILQRFRDWLNRPVPKDEPEFEYFVVYNEFEHIGPFATREQAEQATEGIEWPWRIAQIMVSTEGDD